MARYDGAASGDDDARSVVTSPDGTMVFVTGISVGDTIDYATVAYDAATGGRLWRALYNGPADGEDDALAATVTPDGAAVIITGTSQGGDSPDPGGWDYATVAYDAATGAQLWVSRYDGPGHLSDAAGALATSADGSKVFVTGHSVGTTSDDDYTTIAYRVSSGAKLWVRRYNGPGNGGDVATALATSPDGSKLFVTGSSPGSTSDTDYATVAYRAATGARLWLRRYDGPGDGSDGASSVVPSPDGSRVFVTGSSLGTASDLDYATVAYDAETGARLWLSRYNGPGNADDHARAAAASPDGSRIFVTGFSAGTSGYDYATLAYRADTGARIWRNRYNGPGDANANTAIALAASPVAPEVIVTGFSIGITSSYDFATLSYDSSTGMARWVNRYNGSGNGIDQPRALAISEDGSRVFVTGRSSGETTAYDYATVAYGR